MIDCGPEWFRKALTRSAWFHGPHVTPGDDGETRVEFWWTTRKITFYVTDERVGYIKIWGPNVDTEMLVGENADLADVLALRWWLLHNKTREEADAIEADYQAMLAEARASGLAVYPPFVDDEP